MENRNFLIKIFAILCILLLLSIIILTASRTGIIIVALGSIFYFLFYFRYKGRYNLFRIINPTTVEAIKYKILTVVSENKRLVVPK